MANSDEPTIRTKTDEATISKGTDGPAEGVIDNQPSTGPDTTQEQERLLSELEAAADASVREDDQRRYIEKFVPGTAPTQQFIQQEASDPVKKTRIQSYALRSSGVSPVRVSKNTAASEIKQMLILDKFYKDFIMPLDTTASAFGGTNRG